MHINSLRHDTESTLNKQVGKASSLHMGGTAPKAMDVITIPWISETCPRANKLLWTVSHNTNYNQMHAMQQLLWTVSNNATSYFNLQTENVHLPNAHKLNLNSLGPRFVKRPQVKLCPAGPGASFHPSAPGAAIR